jgi:hypothetical protein
MFRRTGIRLLGLAAAAAALALTAACSDSANSSPLEPSFSPGVPATQVAPLVYCPGTPYDSTKRTIGKRGGIITAGRATFIIPPGAVPVPTTITMVQPADSVASYRFYPEGLQFTAAQPALQIDYSRCATGPTTAPQIVYIDETGQLLERLPTTLLPRRVVQALIFHFSRYAVAF